MAEPHPGKKRKRTAQACGPCRSKKTKCDGIHPVCTPCISLGYACSYNLDSNAPPAGQLLVSQDYLTALEQRILRLEDRGDTASTSPEDKRRVHPPGAEEGVRDWREGTHHTHTPDQRTPRHDMAPPRRGLDEPFSIPLPPPAVSGRASLGSLATQPDHSAAPPIDGMGLLLGPQRADQPGTESEKEVYGDMSGISFHHMLLDRLLPGYWCLATESDEAASGSGYLGLPPLQHVFAVRREDLLPRVEAMAMFEWFENNTWQLYPIIDLATVRSAYIQLLDAAAADPDVLRMPANQPLMALHFNIFALVQAVCDENMTKVDVHTIALRMLRNHLDWPHSTVKVQVLLIGGLVLQGTDRPGCSWDLVGYAIRSAYAVGLQDHAINKTLPPAVCEMRSRVWWACYTFDGLISVSIGRPLTIVASEQMTAPLPRVLPGEQEAPVLFFADSVRLYRELADVISNPPVSFRHANAEFVHSVLTQTYRLERDYAKWCDTVHPRFNAVHRLPAKGLAVVLSLRGLTMRLLLHRRVVLAAIKDYLGGARTPSAPTSSLQLESRQRDLAFGISLGLIVETAVQTVRVLEVACDDESQLNAPWFLLFYAMNAFMSLVATLLLDLTKWEAYITMPGQIVPALRALRAVVYQISQRYHRPSAQQALLIMEHAMSALGLHAHEAPPPNPPAPDAGASGAGAPGPDFLHMPPMGMHDVPHFDFGEVYRSLGLDLAEFGIEV